MPHTARVRGPLARYLLNHPNPALRRRLAILRLTPFPPGSRSLDADAEWASLSQRFPDVRGFVYGTSQNALVYTYDSAQDCVTAEFAIVAGEIVP